MKHIIASFLFTLITSTGWAESWECKQLRDVILSPPYYVDQEETDIAFTIEVENAKIKVLPDAIQIFQCGTNDG